MAAARNVPPEIEDRRNQQNQRYPDRNRTFSSTTTDHYKSKLAHIGIKKDLREILDRKKLEKEYEDSLNSGNSANEVLQVSSRKVRFEDEKRSLRRSKSFTSGTMKHSENDSQVQKSEQKSQPRKVMKDNQFRPSQNSKSNRERKTDFIDLHHPSNIKIELKTDSGDRKCTVDANVSIAGVKCDLKHSRNILKNAEPKEKATESQAAQIERIDEKSKGATHSRGNRGSFKKKREYKDASSRFNEGQKNNNSTLAAVNKSFSNLSVTE